MAWNNTRRTTADIVEESRKAKASAEERRCPKCQRKGALKVTRTAAAQLIREYGYVLVTRKCRWCGYKDKLHEGAEK